MFDRPFYDVVIFIDPRLEDTIGQIRHQPRKVVRPKDPNDEASVSFCFTRLQPFFGLPWSGTWWQSKKSIASLSFVGFCHQIIISKLTDAQLSLLFHSLCILSQNQKTVLAGSFPIQQVLAEAAKHYRKNIYKQDETNDDSGPAGLLAEWGRILPNRKESSFQQQQRRQQQQQCTVNGARKARH